MAASGDLSALVHPAFAGVSPATTVADDLARACQVARAPWPELSLADEDFLHFLMQRPATPAAPAGLFDLRLSDLYLLCAYQRGDPAAARAIEARYLPRVSAALARLRVSPSEADDIRQQVCKRLLEGAEGNYSGRGELVAWMVIAAVRMASTSRRRSTREVELEHDALFAGEDDAGEDADLALLKRRYRDEFREAFNEALAALSARDRTLLRYNVIDGLNIAQIGMFYGVHRATVARWIAAAREQILAGTRQGLMRRVKIAPSEVDSVLRLIQSQLDVSLRQLLGPADERR